MPATAALWLGGLLVLGLGPAHLTAATAPAASPLAHLKESPLAESVTQEIRVEDAFAFATAKLRWQGVKDQMLPLLFEPAVLTQIQYPSNALKLVQVTVI